MDTVSEIKARLPIEELVRQYCQLQKKGRNFVCLCPFHNDSSPSLLVSPDKGIAYCFACQSGGDIFSFYQKIERVEFPQAIRDLAEKVGVKIEANAPKGPDKDEKERARNCLESAAKYFADQLKQDQKTLAYLKERGVTDDEISTFELGRAPDGFTNAYDYLLNKGHSRSDIVRSGVAIQKNLNEERCFDRFHSRLMFPIHDGQGHMAGFGGRTLINDDAKYMNSSDGILFHKSNILFNLHRAKDAMRAADSVIVVEGYFDVMAVYRVGMKNVVATCGTALTADHAKILKRAVSKVVLCLDSDRAGREAMERAFLALAPEGVQVSVVILPEKDPADLALSDADLLRSMIEAGGAPYLDVVLQQLRDGDSRSAAGKRAALDRLQPLLMALSSPAEFRHYLERASDVTGLHLSEIEAAIRQPQKAVAHLTPVKTETNPKNMFSSADIALGLFFLYPQLRELIREIIPPEEAFASVLYKAISSLDAATEISVEALDLDTSMKERATILQLFCEDHLFGTWSELHAPREMRRNIVVANRELLRRKQIEISDKLMAAKKSGKQGEEELLRTQYQEILKLAHLAR